MSGQDRANHRIGEQATTVGENHVIVLDHGQPVDYHLFGERRSDADSSDNGSPVRNRAVSMTRSMCSSSAVSSSLPPTGSSPSANCSAYRAGCLTFHHRTPPT